MKDNHAKKSCVLRQISLWFASFCQAIRRKQQRDLRQITTHDE